jgi:hypothetical protein
MSFFFTVRYFIKFARERKRTKMGEELDTSYKMRRPRRNRKWIRRNNGSPGANLVTLYNEQQHQLAGQISSKLYPKKKKREG